MALIQGFAAHAAGAELLPFRYDPGELRAQEVEILISHCGVCHSDLHLIANDWGISQFPFIPGHEIIGAVAAVGPEVQSLEAGQRVGVGWQANSCGLCEWCSRGMENLCALAEPTCVRRHGGYAQAVRVNARFAIPIPDAISSEGAAPLLCGGITVYNPLRSHGINPSSRVGIVGIGGLGHIALQFARVFGAEVTAFSTSKAKEGEARGSGQVRLHPDDGKCGSGLESVHTAAATDWNALLCRSSAVAGLSAGVSAGFQDSHHHRQPDRQPAHAARDDGCGCAAWGEGAGRELSDGQGE